jgi:outer membrane protein assembly factor BamB
MMKLNSRFDPDAGTLSVEPSEFLKFTYDTDRTRAGMRKSPSSYWLGMEDSAVMWNQWLYIADNGGNFFCLDTQTMEIVWMQNILDDSNSTPVLEEEDGHPYLYISTSLHWTAKNSRGNIPIWKIDGLTGEIIWETSYPCHTVSGISGGVEGTGLLGTGDIADLIIYPVARTPSQSSGILVALNKKTGKEEWKLKMNFYTWSSPVAIKDESGKTYIVICDSNGQMFLLDGKNGKKLSHVDLGANIEASPAVFNDMIVVGTRGRKIFGVRVS